ncbi:MAG: TonB-dependent receptor [Verrucomicrobiota bacterium]
MVLRKQSAVTLLLSILYSGIGAADTLPSDELPIIELEDYIVTGSRFSAETSAIQLPVDFISADSLSLWREETAISALRAESYNIGSANTENDSNGGDGSASANLRGLGTLSTLTLINGRRAGGNSAFLYNPGGFSDLNLIPVAAIREVEILTEGTSVAYGSDAVAGTVNIMLHDDYVGTRIEAGYSDTTDGDASEKTFSFLTGQELNEKTHLVLLGSWYQRNAIYARDRDISEDTDRRAQGGQNQGSPFFPGRISVSGVEYVLPSNIDAPTNLGQYELFDPLNDLYNFSEFAPAVPEVERKSLMANITHQLTDNLELWGEGLFTTSTFYNALAPAPWTAAPNGFENPGVFSSIVNTPSPHIPAGINPADIERIAYRSFELGNLAPEQEKTALRGLIGLRGTFSDWNWETALLYSEVETEWQWSGVTDARILSDLIETGEFNPFAQAFATGTIPSGPLAGQTYDNAAALEQAEADPVDLFKEQFWSYDISASRSFLELPAGELETAFGFEYRDESIEADIDEIFVNSNNLGGPVRESYGGDRKVYAGFLESLIPIYRKGSQSLDLNASIRYEEYRDSSDDSSVTGNQYNAFVYKLGTNFKASEALKFRLSYGTAFRAPTLTESYGGSVIANPIYNDPLGFTADSARINTLISSNSDLDPEESTTVNAGFVFAPDPAKGWRLEIEYYKIKTQDGIVNGAQFLVDQNAAGQPNGVTPGTLAPTAPNAGQIIRNPVTGQLLVVFSEFFNVAEIETDGIDYTLSYFQPTSEGNWEASIRISQVLSYDVTAAPGAATQSYLGDFIDPAAPGGNIVGRGSIPRYKGYARFVWNHRNLTLGATYNYIHSLDDNTAFTTTGQQRKIDSWQSLDLVARYTWPESALDWLDGVTLTLSAENVTDEAPPFAAGAFADGYDRSLYSLEGRRMGITLAKDF